MAECDIKKFDGLPGRVGWRDVDYLRFKLSDNKKKIEHIKEENKKIIRELKEAKKQYGR